MRPELSVVIVNWNTKDLLRECLRSLYRTVKDLSFDVYVVDNGSSDGSVEMVEKEFPGATLIRNRENRGFAPANNQALREIHTAYVFLLNTDTVLLNGTVGGMVSFLKKHPDVAIVAPQFLNRDGSKQNTFDNFPSLTTELMNKSMLRFLFPGSYPSKHVDYKEPLEVESVLCAGVVLRQDVFRQVGFFDEDYFVYLDDSDICFRLKRAGYRCFYLPQLEMYHFGGGGTKAKGRANAVIEYYRSMYKFFKKNRSAPEYLILKVLKPLRLVLSLFLSLLGLALTLFLHKGLRSRVYAYLKVLEWHARGCPSCMGIGGRQAVE
ncbi:MAG: glycosyltransferase family 2 protein [Candidatus Brocadiales bacterium]|nr:glycosyltransferase family 2 protein [Candidatus Bathyanammoxibius sp.]